MGGCHKHTGSENNQNTFTLTSHTHTQAHSLSVSSLLLCSVHKLSLLQRLFGAYLTKQHTKSLFVKSNVQCSSCCNVTWPSSPPIIPLPFWDKRERETEGAPCLSFSLSLSVCVCWGKNWSRGGGMFRRALLLQQSPSPICVSFPLKAHLCSTFYINCKADENKH